MRNRVLYSIFVVVVLTLAIAPVAIGGEDARAAQVLTASREAIGGKTLDTLKTLSVESVLQRNINTLQISSDVEILVELPDKYVRSDQPHAPGMIAGTMTTGFNGEKAIQPVQGGSAGGAMVIRMGGPAAPSPEGPKLTPEEQEKLEKSVVRNQKFELSRLMLGWFATTHPSVGAHYTFAGEAESPDGRAYVIDVTGAEGFAARVFIDQKTNLPLMVSYKAPQRQIITAGPGRVMSSGTPAHGGGTVTHSGGRPPAEEERKRLAEDVDKQIAGMQKQPPVMVDYTLYFDEWEPVDGVQFPRRIRRASEGTTTEEWTIGKVRINPKIDAKRFAVKG